MPNSELATPVVARGPGARLPIRSSPAFLQAQLCEHPPRLVSVSGGRDHRPPRPHQLHAHVWGECQLAKRVVTQSTLTVQQCAGTHRRRTCVTVLPGGPCDMRCEFPSKASARMPQQCRRSHTCKTT